MYSQINMGPPLNLLLALRQFVQKLQDKSFTKEEKMQVIEDVAEEFTIPFNTKAFEWKISGVPPNKKELLKKVSFNGVEVEASGRNGHRVDKHAVLDRKSKSILFPVGSLRSSAELK